MKTLNYLKIAVLFVCALAFYACDDDNDSLDDKLCRTWISETIEIEDEQQMLCTHKLIFIRKGHSGQEIRSKRNPVSGTTHTETRDFTWRWEDGSQECLIMSYGAGEVKYFENVWVRDHYLQGKLDGDIVMMVDQAYQKK